MISPFWGARPAVVSRGTTATRMAAGIYGPPVTNVVGPGYRVQGHFGLVGPGPAQIVFASRWLRAQSLTFAESTRIGPRTASRTLPSR